MEHLEVLKAAPLFKVRELVDIIDDAFAQVPKRLALADLHDVPVHAPVEPLVAVWVGSHFFV